MLQGPPPNEITLSYCDSYELRVFPCSKITKIYLALLCQCSIGPPKKRPQFVASFTASSWTRGELVRAGAYQKAETNKNSTSIGGEFKYFAHGRSIAVLLHPDQVHVAHILLPPSSIYRLPFSRFVTHLLPKQVAPTATILRSPVQMAANWDEATQNIGAVIYIYMETLEHGCFVYMHSKYTYISYILVVQIKIHSKGPVYKYSISFSIEYILVMELSPCFWTKKHKTNHRAILLMVQQSQTTT